MAVFENEVVKADDVVQADAADDGDARSGSERGVWFDIGAKGALTSPPVERQTEEHFAPACSLEGPERGQMGSTTSRGR